MTHLTEFMKLFFPLGLGIRPRGPKSIYFQLFPFISILFPGKCVKFNKRPAPLSSVSDSSFYKSYTNNRRNSAVTTPTQKPLRERIIHLLALKPYRKPELLLWLERERASPKDKAELGAILEEVKKEVFVPSESPIWAFYSLWSHLSLWYQVLHLYRFRKTEVKARCNSTEQYDIIKL